MDNNNNYIDEAKYRILVVEDDLEVREALCKVLRENGFLCSEAGEIGKAKRIILKSRPDLVVLDLGMPDSDGSYFLREIREIDNLPIIVCTGRGSDKDKINNLDYGADDYITKPFNPIELVSRVKNVLRRSGTTPAKGKVFFGDVVIQLDTREVTKAGNQINLTSKEYDLLLHLARHPRTVFSRDSLLKSVWAVSGDRSEATVTEHVRRLRVKIENEPDNPKNLLAVRGVGYKLIP